MTLYGAMNYGSAPIITPLAPTPSLEPFFTCLGGHDTVRSHELRLGSNNYTALPYSLLSVHGLGL